MFKKIKNYIKTKQQEKWFNDGMTELIQDTINSAYHRMDSKDISMSSIQGYVRHLPIVGIEEGYSKEVYIDAAKCIIDMWKYAINMHLISSDISFMDFMGYNIGFRRVSNGCELRYELSDGRIVDWKEYLEPLRKLADSLQKDK